MNEPGPIVLVHRGGYRCWRGQPIERPGEELWERFYASHVLPTQVQGEDWRARNAALQRALRARIKS